MKRADSYSTEKRNKIMEYLITHKDEDVSVKDIELHLTSEGISTNITTIYRYLDKLVSQGTLLKHMDGNGSKSTFQYVQPDSACHNHLHMKCSNCGRIYHMDCGFMMEFSRHIYEHHSFMLDCKTSMLYGLCKQCADNCQFD